MILLFAACGLIGLVIGSRLGPFSLMAGVVVFAAVAGSFAASLSLPLVVTTVVGTTFFELFAFTSISARVLFARPAGSLLASRRRTGRPSRPL